MRFFPGDDAYSVSRLPPLSSWDASRCIGALDAKGECLATLPAMTQFNPLKLGSNPELNSSAQTASCVHVISRALGRCRLATRRFTVYRFPYGRSYGIERPAALRKFNDLHGSENPRGRLAAAHRAVRPPSTAARMAMAGGRATRTTGEAAPPESRSRATKQRTARAGSAASPTSSARNRRPACLRAQRAISRSAARIASAVAVTIVSRSMSKQMPVASLIVLVTAAAALSAANGSSVCQYSSGRSPPAG